MVFLSGFPGVKNNKISGDFITGRSDNSQTASTNEKSTLKIIAHPSASYGLLPKRWVGAFSGVVRYSITWALCSSEKRWT